ncbi:hypothetical protein BKA82DRAFT_142041 [Pisolithus tinctorius]|uniref:MYND-type domain-containing protein n=1 Tax=Pisolithus tinctorius Marx 270 TaxID=870435 RepID=A0A0C3NVS9_PISTI|nr:hypothetical protein BKA82DRAFT_142041 [Pisolithus tinctorius]KIO04970.1 hypothetical protein M404DRAFT_142041 [Pisolithus tinctorius Marx 270]
MSFADLKSKRQSKSRRTYVSCPSDAPHTSGPLLPQVIADPWANKDAQLPTPPDDNADLHILPRGDLYKELPSWLAVRESTSSGRSLWNHGSTNIRPGDVILSLRPHVFTLSTTYLDSHCSGCAGSPVSGLKRCTGCRKVWYCTSTCQNNDWPTHKLECTAIQNWSAEAPSDKVSVPSDAVRCLGRILWRIRRRGVGSIWVKEIQAMQSNRKSIHPSAVEGHTHLAQSVVRYLGASSPTELEDYGIMSAADLVDLISRFIINTVALTTPSLTPIGVAVSPLIALINHSCTPNVVVVFPRSRKDSRDEPVAKVAALRNIAPGEEILMSYVDTTLPKSLRQMTLTETYNFQCHCKACTKSGGVDPREAVWCPKACGGTCPIPTESNLAENRISGCTNCGAAINDPDAVMDVVRVGQEALHKATNLQDNNKAKSLTANIISVLISAGLTPSTHPLLALLKLHQTLLISSFPTPLTQEVLNETIRISGKYSVGLSAILDEGHPVRAMSLVELGKLLAVDEPSPPTSQPKNGSFPPSGPARLKAAYETLLRARKELLIGFGRQTEGGEVGDGVRETLVTLEKELEVWSTRIRNVLEDTPS